MKIMKLNNITTPKIMAMVVRTERMLSMVVLCGSGYHDASRRTSFKDVLMTEGTFKFWTCGRKHHNNER